MSEFWIFVEIGVKHVLNWNGYDHLLFLLALAAPYAFSDWKRLLVSVSLFTLGHSVSLFIGAYDILRVQPLIIEFLIPLTIFVTALFTLLSLGKFSKTKDKFQMTHYFTVFFGLIHGLGFSFYFNSLLAGSSSAKLFSLIQFSIGIELAQVLVVVAVLIFSTVFQSVLRFSQRDFTLTLSAFVLGVVLPLLIQNPIWN
ncbi:MAG: HupE/UreJ family protein [Flavobacterium sp.]|nr:HupE/UreJ family protein [Flavobacterium sp.]